MKSAAPLCDILSYLQGTGSILVIYLGYRVAFALNRVSRLYISMKLALLVALICLVIAVDPPVYGYSYRISFDQTWISNKTIYEVNGQTFYDPANNRERVDRSNGRYDLFCGTVLPNVTTPCQQITTNNKRWIIYPARSACCFCCDSEHGCGILSPDWLKGAEYKGKQKLIDIEFDKWSKSGDFGYNYFWTTADENQIPRRLDENGDHLTDYNTASFHNQTVPFADSIFALPSYCTVDQPSNCPLQSICGKLRSNLQAQ